MVSPLTPTTTRPGVKTALSAPTGLAKGLSNTDFSWKPASEAQYDPSAWNLMSQTPWAGSSANPTVSGEWSPQGDFAPAGYEVGFNKLNNVGTWALRDPQGQITHSYQGPARDSLASDDYALMATMASLGYGLAGAAGAASAGGAEAVSGMDLAADAAVGSGNNVTTAASMFNNAAPVTGAAVPASSAPASTPSTAPTDWSTKLADGLMKNPAQTAMAGVALAGAGGGNNTVPVLDPTSAAAQQGAANKDASLFDAYLNRPDQITPQGSLKWTLKPGADPKNPQPGDWIQTTALNETGQQLYDADQALQLGMTGTSQAALGRVNDTLGQALDTSGLPAMGQVSNFTGADRQRIEDALMARLNPGFAQDEEAMRSRTLNTGFELGSEGSQREQFRLDKAKNDARLAAIAQSGQEAERLGNISRADASFQNQSRQQGLQEILAQRALPLNELNALRSGSQVQQPTFSPVSQSNTASAPVLDALMAQLSGQQANAANKQSGYNALLASLAQLGGSIWGD